ncbi:NADH dehydrogenase subunit 2 (mitochondrion) [Hortaea werneckii EXF-2000]|uniref:NADH-ubiquinone oxidoreductase chain 2 n=1 Tax=Hortaea werneckii EXF-2000 TaxID=1157616 RepID=A0A1Z5SKY8_HORWE|nr:NADH dehydrogenase subunit 2 [Hortaea werneckii EXF-2000]
MICGAVFLISTADLVSIFLSIELQSYGLYILSSLYRDSEVSTGSGLTYFLLGGLSSCFILLGSALLYANSGTTSLDNIYVITSMSEINTLPYLTNWYEPYYLHLSLIIMSVGFLFKISAAPFHFWSPDVYDGIPTIVTTYVAIVAKISIFAFFLELVYYTEYNFFDFYWKNILLVSSLFSLIIGSILGLTQSRIKRLYAYSTISHVGFILLALSINSAESIQSYIFYILQYSLSNLNAFIILVTIGFTFYLYVSKEKESKEELIDENNSPVQLINQVKGYFYVNPFIAISLSITLFSFVGVPPVIGFFAKQMILSAALDNGYIFMALVAILTSVIGAGYYLAIVKQIFFYKGDYSKIDSDSVAQGYFRNSYVNEAHMVGYVLDNRKGNTDKPLKKIPFKTDSITINSSLSSTISIITLLLILFIYVPGQWFNVVNILTLILFKA